MLISKIGLKRPFECHEWVNIEQPTFVYQSNHIAFGDDDTHYSHYCSVFLHNSSRMHVRQLTCKHFFFLSHSYEWWSMHLLRSDDRVHIFFIVVWILKVLCRSIPYLHNNFHRYRMLFARYRKCATDLAINRHLKVGSVLFYCRLQWLRLCDLHAEKIFMR